MCERGDDNATKDSHLRRDVRSGVPRNAYTRKEALLGGPHVDDICSTIGNVARIATVVELQEAVAACEAAEHHALQLLLLDPHRKPISPHEHLQNRQILEAFVQFRWHLETIRRAFPGDVDLPENGRSGVSEMTREA